MKILDLFSGIGGFSLGLERAGFETVAFCEIEPYCQKVLRKHWPDVPIFEDVRKLTAKDLPDDIRLICGGYPCQPFSLAGKREGQEDDRHLWPEVARLIQELRPDWFIGENVAGHITMGLDSALSDLEGLSYTWETFVIPACAVDAPHRRDRVWVVAHTSGAGLQKSACTGLGSISRAAETPQRGLPGGAFTAKWRTWPVEPDVGRVADGVPDRVDRVRALGNAVVPQIPELIGRAILAQEDCLRCRALLQLPEGEE